MTTHPTPAEIDEVMAELSNMRRHVYDFSSTYIETAVLRAEELIQRLRTPQPDEGWVKLSDVDRSKIAGNVIAGSYRGDKWSMSSVFKGWSRAIDYDRTHYFVLPDPPPAPELTAEQKQAQEDEKAFVAVFGNEPVCGGAGHAQWVKAKDGWRSALIYARPPERMT